MLIAHVVAEDEYFRYGHAPGMLDALQACLADHFAVQVEHFTCSSSRRPMPDTTAKPLREPGRALTTWTASGEDRP